MNTFTSSASTAFLNQLCIFLLNLLVIICNFFKQQNIRKIKDKNPVCALDGLLFCCGLLTFIACKWMSKRTKKLLCLWHFKASLVLFSFCNESANVRNCTRNTNTSWIYLHNLRGWANVKTLPPSSGEIAHYLFPQRDPSRFPLTASKTKTDDVSSWAINAF